MHGGEANQCQVMLKMQSISHRLGRLLVPLGGTVDQAWYPIASWPINDCRATRWVDKRQHFLDSSAVAFRHRSLESLYL